MKQKYSFTRLGIMTTCALCFFLLAAQFAAAQNENDIAMLNRSAKAFSSVVRKAGPAVVYIGVEKTTKDFSVRRQMDMFNDPFFEHFFGKKFDRFRQDPTPFKQHGAGSGFIISEDGLILTNNHVVDNAETIRVRLADKREFAASVVGTDSQSDVALIKIEGKDLPTLPLGDSHKLEVGEWVVAIGSPFELSQTVTVGVVSAKGRSRMGINDYENFIQTDAAINPGNSGGPLLNIHGKVVGINTAIFSRSGGYMGIGFAIPINMAKSIEQQLRSNGKVTRGWLGLLIQDMDENLARSFGVSKGEGILVAEITAGSPAEKAGIKQGDILLSLDGDKLNDVTSLRNRIAMISPGNKVNLQIFRNGRKKNVHVLIAEQPSDFNKTARMKTKKKNSSILDKMGLTLQELTPELAKQFGYSEKQGVIITQVTRDSPADSVAIQPGQLIEEANRVRVHSLNELKKALKKGKKFGLPVNAKLIGTAGSLGSSRGIEVLFKAANNLTAEDPSIHLIVAGQLESGMVLPKGANIHYLGKLDYNQVPILFNALNVGIICNRESSFGRYCFPQKAYEMMACGLPVVAADVGAMSEIFVEHPEHLYTLGNHHALAQAIRKQLACSATLPCIEILTWADLAKELEIFLLDIVS
ncbi:MAG: Do family serine endopeptidase [Candidatus Electrothrix sp. AR4]|nr:Do family serine endopeptidase [Candidatus Electrothrix sp. AR4]